MWQQQWILDHAPRHQDLLDEPLPQRPGIRKHLLLGIVLIGYISRSSTCHLAASQHHPYHQINRKAYQKTIKPFVNHNGFSIPGRHWMFRPPSVKPTSLGGRKTRHWNVSSSKFVASKSFSSLATPGASKSLYCDESDPNVVLNLLDIHIYIYIYIVCDCVELGVEAPFLHAELWW